jgi:hypothetical protein
VSQIIVLGVDTGDTAGFLLAGWEPGARKCLWARAWQADGYGGATDLLAMLIRSMTVGTPSGVLASAITAVEIEAFDGRPKAHGLAGTNPGRIGRQVQGMTAACRGDGIPVYVRRAAEVKPWIDAGDARLAAAGLLDVCSPAAMKHAKSAAWHALYCAVRNCGLPDPLSRRRGDGSG